jgi:prepilin-type N-terminal cleavage/methylation domain-containing protein
MFARSGFTLIELLVVVTIIVILLALLAPALDKAVEQAERAVCASRLHAWGLAIPQYALDHRNRLPFTLRNQGNNDLYPVLTWGDNDTRPGYDTVFDRKKWEDWSAQTMQPYIGRGDYLQRDYRQAYYCPSNPSTAIREQTVKTEVDHPQGGWVASGYAYFARAELWGAAHATRPQELTEGRLAAGRLLMADTIYYAAGPAAWWFNHGEDGPSVQAARYGSPTQSGVPRISGANQLMGEGAVGWKDRSEFDTESMFQRALGGRYVSAARGPNANSNLSFW